jgi:hypothetical protein
MRADEFVQLQVQGFGVSILRVLDEKYDEEGNDGSAGINDELPCIREMEERAAHRPQNQDDHGEEKHIRMPDHVRCLAGKPAEPQIDAAGLPDLLMGVKIGLAMFSGHGCK